MRVNGLNVLAIIVAAIAMYAIGFLFYGVLFSDLWMSLSGYTEDSLKGQEWKMALGPVMPILLAIGLSIACKWRGAIGLVGGVMTGAITWLFFVLSTAMYAFAYSTAPALLFGIDALHLFLISVVGGAIVSVWK